MGAWVPTGFFTEETPGCQFALFGKQGTVRTCWSGLSRDLRHATPSPRPVPIIMGHTSSPGTDPLLIHNIVAANRCRSNGDGQNVRDWLHVRYHAEEIEQVLKHG